MSDYSQWYPDGHIVYWSQPVLECTCGYSKRMQRTSIPYCSHIEQLIADQSDAKQGRSISRALSQLKLPIFHDMSRQWCYWHSVNLLWSDEQHFAVETEGEVVGYGSFITSRREIIDMIIPRYVELHYKKPCSRCKAIVPRDDLLQADGLRAALFAAASVKHHGNLCAACAELVPQP